jgi:hypothetical protein
MKVPDKTGKNKLDFVKMSGMKIISGFNNNCKVQRIRVVKHYCNVDAIRVCPLSNVA